MLLSDDEILNSAASTLGEMHVENCGLGDIKDFALAVEAAILAKLASAELPEPVVWEDCGYEGWYPTNADIEGDVYETYTADQLRQAFAQGASSQLSAEPAAKQFQTVDGGWHPFLDLQHEEHTIADGRWPIRELFTLKEPK